MSKGQASVEAMAAIAIMLSAAMFFLSGQAILENAVSEAEKKLCAKAEAHSCAVVADAVFSNSLGFSGKYGCAPTAGGVEGMAFGKTAVEKTLSEKSAVSEGGDLETVAPEHYA